MNIDPDTLRDMALGLGRGLMAYDPNNPFAGAGAALSTTIAASEERRQAKKRREEALSDRAEALGEDRRIRGETRKFQLEDEARRRRERQEDEPTLAEKIEETTAIEEAKIKVRLKGEREMQEMMRGLRGNYAGSVTSPFLSQLHRDLGGVVPTVGGSAPRAFTQSTEPAWYSAEAYRKSMEKPKF